MRRVERRRAMDIPRTGEAEKRRLRRNIGIGVGIAVVLLISAGLSRLEPAAPTVERETVMTDVVKRGLFLRQVRGPGSLVPEDVRWISSPVNARVERIPALPGVEVQADTILLEMSDPQIQQNALEAEAQLKGAQADYDDLKAQLENQLLNQQAQVTEAESQSEQANLQEEADEKLAKDGLIPALNLKLSRLRAAQLTKQARIEKERVAQSRRSADAQLVAQRARVSQMMAMYDLRRRQVESLTV